MKNRTKVIIGGAAAGTLMAGTAAGLGVVLAARRGLRMLREHRLRELRGKTVLITGGSRGLGLALAEEFAQFGAKVAICARDEQAGDYQSAAGRGFFARMAVARFPAVVAVRST